MEELFNLFKGVIITHPNYVGVVCGYNETHFILAVETKDENKFFRRLKKDFFIAEEYKDLKYRYIFEDESTIIKQMRWQDQKRNQNQEQKAS
jgi:hypothetical protein